MTSEEINALCEKFGVTVDYLMPRLVAYYRMGAIIGVVFSVGAIAAGIILCLMLDRRCKKTNEVIVDDPLIFFSFLCGLGMVLVGVVVGLIEATEMAKLIASPEAYVIMRLVAEAR